MTAIAGRRILLTGASRGLGERIARRLHEAGASLVLSARPGPALERLAGELGGATVIPADLSRRGEAERLAAEAGPVDILVANAGVPASGALAAFSVEQIERALDVNLRAPMVLTRELVPGMVARGRGHVVLVASLAGKVPAPKSSVYNATKFGLRGFGHAMRAELRGTGVSVSLVSPTFVTEAGMFHDSGARSAVRTVTAGDVAEAVLKAIVRNRAEIVVAPPEQRVFGRVALAVPELLHNVARGAGSLPDRAVEGQAHRR